MNGFGSKSYYDADVDSKLCSVEAEAAIKEVAFGVKEIVPANPSLTCTDSLAYLNLTTLEGERMCVEITVRGFCPVGQEYDQTELPSTDKSAGICTPEYYETIYALLSARSARFRDKFSQRLCEKLKELDDPRVQSCQAD
ncbi:GSK3-beta interaction protein [Paragonimus heterotremus]|uniref:GSK3-beta interaction protein n=1 Tax=Paragonimus heterotremus TaxID=100268 RepID=A0A8J4WK43_9TREM|nr:GSK3-beta interaction protein [Paragonimus heterotremus]